MKVVLIYDNGEEYEPFIKVIEFEGKNEMINFINENKIGARVLAAYEFYNKIEIEPFEKVVNYRVKR